MASKGLPGFLRRSLRPVEYDDQSDSDEEQSGDDHPQNGQTDAENEPVIPPAPVEASNTIRSTSLSMADTTASSSDPPSSFSSNNTPGNGLTNERQTRAESLPVDYSLRSAGSATSPTIAGMESRDSWHNPTTDEGSPPQKTYRESQFEKILGADVVHLSELRQLAWNGVPNMYRAQVWKLLLGYLPTNATRRDQTISRKRSEYKAAIAQHYDIDDNVRTLQEQDTLRQVLVDVPRTQPDIPLFRNDRIKRVLSRLLYIWAMRHPASSYVQGINDLATPLVAVFLADYFEGSSPCVILDGHVMNHLRDEKLGEVEADVYWCLTNLLAGIQDHYTADQPGVQRMVGRLEELVTRIDSDLVRHVRDETGIQFLQFSFKWMNCLLLREFHLRCVFRLWDTYLSEKEGFEDFHVYVCAAFMCQFSSQLQEMSFDELFGFMQEIPTGEWTDTEIEVLLSQAYVLSTLFKNSDAHLTASNSGMQPLER